LRDLTKIDFTKDVVKTTKYKYSSIVFDVFEFGGYKDARDKLGMSIQKTCFVCNRRFSDNDNLALLNHGNKDNKLCCDSCGREIVDKYKI
jgi:hypothetical protein